ncbi:OPT family oligopeptide transporter, partial [Lysobacter sp. 2RAB21]
PDLGEAIAAAAAEYALVRDLHADLLELDEDAQIDAVQQGYVNFYPDDGVNPYIALAARGPWVITLKGAVLHDSGGYGMLGFGHTPSAVIAAMAKPQVMANIMTPSLSQLRFERALRAAIGVNRGGCPFERFFCLNSGSESVSLAARIADGSAEAIGRAIWSAKVRYLGVGTMLIGGVWTLFSLRKSLLSGVKSGLAAARKGSSGVVAETDRDLPMKWMLIALVAFVMPLMLLYQAIVGNWFVSVPMTIIMIVAGFLFVSVSAYLAGLIGSSNNPVSGITISTILFASAVLVLMLGRDSPIGAVAAIMIGAVVCCAAAVGGDNLQDLKAGYIVGATPWKQQLMLGIGTFSCALIMAPILNLLAAAYGIGAPTAEHPNSLAAPQATLMASVAKGMFGGELPWTMIGIGAGIGVVIIAFDEWLKSRKSKFRVPVLAAAIGIYLPLELMVPIFLGGVLSHIVGRRRGLTKDSDEAEVDRVHRPGTLFAAGLITGEALMGIAIAFPIVISTRA